MPDRRACPDLPEDFAFVTEGLLQGTTLATPVGWRRVEDLSPGDRLLTFDGGPAEVVALQSAEVLDARPGWPMSRWPLCVGAGALGNREVLRLLPDQPVLLECDQAERMFGDPFALVPAAALTGWRGIAHEPPRAVERAITPVLALDEVVYAAGGALLWCPADTTVGLPGFPAVPQRDGDRAGYVPLSLASARQLVACLIAEDVGAALSRAAPGGGQAALRVLEP